MKVKEKLLGVSKAKKIMVAGVAILLVGGIGGTVYASNQSQKKIATATIKLEELNKKVKALFDSKNSDFLAKDVEEKQINDLKYQVSNEVLSENKKMNEVRLNEYNNLKNDVDERLKEAEKLSKSQSAINSLFKQDEKEQALNGTNVNKELPITNDLNQSTLDELRTDIESVKEPTSFDKQCIELIEIAEDQLKQISKAKTEVAKVFKDGKVTSTDKKAYDTAKAETDKIKNAKAKKDLADQLAKVKADIDKKAKEDAGTNEANTTSDATQDNQQVNNDETEGETGSNQSTDSNSDTGYSQSYNGNQGTGGENTGDGVYTPPTDNGSTSGGSSSGNNQGGSGSNDGGSTAPSNTIDPMTPVGSGGLFGSYDQAYSAGMAEGLRLQKQDGVQRRTVVWEVKYTDGRSAGWTYQVG